MAEADGMSLAVDDWPATIGELLVLRQRELQLEGAEDELTLPAVAASEERLAATEATLGHRLDPAFRNFLRHADGWRRFQLDYTLFGCGALSAEPPRVVGEMGLSFLEPGEYRELFGADHDDLVVIGGSEDDDDVFVMAGPHADRPGEVTWFYSHGVVGRHPTFDDFFLGQLELVRRAVAALERGQEAQSCRIVVRDGQCSVVPVSTEGQPETVSLPLAGLDPDRLGAAASTALAASSPRPPSLGQEGHEQGVTVAVFRAHPIYRDHLRVVRTGQHGGVDSLKILLGLEALSDPPLLGRAILQELEHDGT